MVSWATIQTLLILIGPPVYRKLRSFYLSTRTGAAPVPLPSTTKRLLDILFINAAFALLTTTPYLFWPENIFTATHSRLQTPTDVLFARVSKFRPLNPTDDVLRSRLQSKDGRLLYTVYGPQPLIECNWCTIDEPNTFMWYALPAIVIPHLLHVVVLGLVTSSYFSRFGRMWRTQATIAGVALFAVEVWFVAISGSALRANSMARSEADIVWLHWRMRLFRGVAIAMVDGLLGYVIYLSATRRWTLGWENEAFDEKLQDISRRIERASGFMHAGNYLKQTVMRDPELRGKCVEWWIREEAAGKEAMEDDEVKNIRAQSLPGRMNLEHFRMEAMKRSEGLMNILQEGL